MKLAKWLPPLVLILVFSCKWAIVTPTHDTEEAPSRGRTQAPEIDEKPPSNTDLVAPQESPLAPAAVSSVAASGIPRLTEEEKERAIQIALGDSRVKELLSGKNYVVAPTGRAGTAEIGVWHMGARKLGATVVISFDRSHFIEYDWPYDEGKSSDLSVYEKKTSRRGSQVKSLDILIDLYVTPGEGRVSRILPLPFNP